MKEEIEIYQNISAQLEKRRSDLSLSKRQLAKLTGISPVYIREVLRGDRKPSVLILRSFCEAMGMTLSELFASLEQEGKL
ncbi:helix-turn-helix domain-containing protein [Mailhella sp.]|uniref:helix-turn-helix domain-containing protein n=1 Tax=Mailhella sp. TaxID=1981029 RepID=UPI004064AE65